MIRRSNPELSKAATTEVDRPSPRITLFAIPKPFEGQIGIIQTNAIRSWAALGDRVEIFLFGDPSDLQSIAAETGARVLRVESNDCDTPILSDAFLQIHQYARGDLIAYLNADILIDGRFLDAADRLRESEFESFLAIGQRIDLSVKSSIQPNPSEGAPENNNDILSESAIDRSGLSANDHEVANGFSRKFVAQQVAALIEQAQSNGSRSSIVCKDYFLFTPDLYRQIPDLLVGRGNWDNWMVHHAKENRIPVIDLTHCVPAVHQQHDHSHVSGGRSSAYIFGSEARENQRLCGGRHLISGSTPTWELTSRGLVRRRFPSWTIVKDLPRFLTLMRNLMFLRYIFAVSTLQLCC